MATTLEDLQVRLSANISGYKKNLNKAVAHTKSSTKQMNKSFDTMKASLGALAGAVTAAFTIKNMVQFSKTCIEVASNLSEVQNVVDTTFGTGNKQIEQFAKSAAKNFGLSELAAKKYASTTGAMLKSMGLGKDDVEEMSIAIAGLSGDMASFYNLEGDAAFNKLRSGLSGETEPLKQLGINMSQVNLETFRMSQGLKTAYKDMSEAEKVTLRYKYILSVTSDAQGDFAKTSDSWANQTRILALNFEQLKATLGQGFINVFLPIIQQVNVLLEKLNELAQVFSDWTGEVFGKADIGPSSVEETADSFGNMADNATDASKAISKVNKGLASFDRLNVLSSNSGGGAGGLSKKSNSSKNNNNPFNPSVGQTGGSNLGSIAGQLWLDDIKFAPELARIINDNLKGAYNSALKGDWQNAKNKLADAIDIGVPFDKNELALMSAYSPLLGGTFTALKNISSALRSMPEIHPKFEHLDGHYKSLKNVNLELKNTSTGIQGVNNGFKQTDSTVKSINTGLTTMNTKVQGVGQSVKNNLNTALGATNTQITAINKGFTGITGTVNGVADQILKRFQKLSTDVSKDTIKKSTATMNSLLDNVEKTLNNMRPGLKEIGGAFGSLGSQDFTAPRKVDLKPIPTKYPTMATGGIVNNPGAGVHAIVGEKGPEAVLPLKKSTFENLGLSGSSAEEIALMKEQNSLLRAILDKDTSISSSDIFSAVKKESKSDFIRTGRNALIY